jgi:hypothetical protein
MRIMRPVLHVKTQIDEELIYLILRQIGILARHTPVAPSRGRMRELVILAFLSLLQQFVQELRFVRVG